MASKDPLNEGPTGQGGDAPISDFEKVLGYNKHLPRPQFWKLALLLHKLNDLEQSAFIILMPPDIKGVLHGFQAHCWAVLAEGRATPIILQLCIIMADYIYVTTRRNMDIMVEGMLGPEMEGSTGPMPPPPGMEGPGNPGGQGASPSTSS